MVELLRLQANEEINLWLPLWYKLFSGSLLLLTRKISLQPDLVELIFVINYQHEINHKVVIQSKFIILYPNEHILGSFHIISLLDIVVQPLWMGRSMILQLNEVFYLVVVLNFFSNGVFHAGESELLLSFGTVPFGDQLSLRFDYNIFLWLMIKLLFCSSRSL